MRRLLATSLCALATCAGPDVAPPALVARAPIVQAPPADAAPAPASEPVDAAVDDAPAAATETPGVDATPPVAPAPERWLKGSTHVHARPSGDSRTPIADVIRWYEDRGYDFIVLSDHNKISELDDQASTVGSPAIRMPEQRGLIVLAGVELTHNPDGCTPPQHPSNRCRIHVNLLGPTARPVGKIDWTTAARKTRERLAKYELALDQRATLGGIAQLNHPNWYWGMTADVLVALARRGLGVFELVNAQYLTWDAGDNDHPSTEALWEAVLRQGVTLYGVAADDAHDYAEGKTAKYPAGGAWIAVKAAREPQAILAAIAAGRFYASTGVVLARAEVEAGERLVEVAPGERGTYTIDFIENGQRVAHVRGTSARRAIPEAGYLRAVVVRGDGKRAWVQPARR